MKRLIPLFFLIHLTFTVNIYAQSYTGIMRRGDRYYRTELYGKALEYYLQGREKNRNAPEPLFNAGDSSYRMEDYVKSLEYYSDTLLLERNEKKKADIFYNMGNSYFKLEEYERAIEYYKKALDINPYELNIKYNLELSLKKLKERSKKEDTNNQGEGKRVESEAKDQEKTTGGSKDLGEGEKKERDERTNGEREELKKDFTREEAARLFNSINSDQREILGDIIKERLGKAKYEKDW